MSERVNNEAMKRLPRMFTQAVGVALIGCVLVVGSSWASALFAPVSIGYQENWTEVERTLNVCGGESTLKIFDEARSQCVLDRVGNIDGGVGSLPPRRKDDVSCFPNMGAVVIESSYGWPLFAMQTTFRKGNNAPTYFDGLVVPQCKVLDLVVRDRVGIHTSSSPYRPLPLRAIWPNFAVNALFWSGVVSVIWFVAKIAHASLRRHRGLCVKCAYDVRGVPICPECGTSVTHVNTTSHALPSLAGGAA